jgi:hypothetical protein
LAAKQRRQTKRQRRAQREARHDLRARYRESDLVLMNGSAGVAVIEDPYTEPARIDAEGNLDVRARLEPAQHRDGSTAEGQPEWTPPARPKLTVVTALRDDPLGRMFARRQIDRAQFEAGREFQGLVDPVETRRLRSLDLTKPTIDKIHGSRCAEPLSDRQRRLAVQLHKVSLIVAERFGSAGLSVTRAVLADRRSVEQAARLHGAESARDISSVSWLFRRCLNLLANKLGFASSVRPARHHPGRDLPAEPAKDPALKANEAETRRSDAAAGATRGLTWP